MAQQRFLTGEEVLALLTGLIHPPKQVGPASVTLTVRAVEKVVGPGSLDFGGSEWQPVETEPVEAVKTDTQEPYGWWDLGRGRYRLAYNEAGAVADGHIGLLAPWAEAVSSGLIHPTVFLPPGAQISSIVVAVGAFGIRIKENARVSELALYRLG
ncbi:MAG: dCTP deaminase [Nitrospinae bacterium]|nr:dCTP deaminase [Nitrospinota bacterium]